MKTPLFAILGLMVLTAAGWRIKSAFESPADKPTSPIVSSAPGSGQPDHFLSAPEKPAVSIRESKTQATNKQPSFDVQNSAVPTAYVAGTSASSVQQASSPRSTQGSPTSGKSVPQTASQSSFYSSSSAHAPTAASASAGSSIKTTAISSGTVVAPSMAAAAEPAPLELDPGVPVPAALLQPQENQPPTVAAAQQQLADSFVQDVNAALSQPATGNNDAAASQAYYDSLSTSNEQYRSLYGNDSYNSATMRAMLEAQSSN